MNKGKYNIKYNKHYVFFLPIILIELIKDSFKIKILLLFLYKNCKWLNTILYIKMYYIMFILLNNKYLFTSMSNFNSISPFQKIKLNGFIMNSNMDLLRVVQGICSLNVTCISIIYYP